MRQFLGKKKIAYYRNKLGLPVIDGLARGNTDHTVELLLEGHIVINLFKDGTYTYDKPELDPRIISQNPIKN